MGALEGVGYSDAKDIFANPQIEFDGAEPIIRRNLEKLKNERQFSQHYRTEINNLNELIFDVSMETGTGKTYTYTKTIFELHKHLGLSKFVIAVPRLAIKAGTVNFLKSESSREHFRDEYNTEINVYEVKSGMGKKGRNKKERFPSEISDFCRANSGYGIHVLVINSGMINSPTMSKDLGVSLLDRFSNPFDGIAGTAPILIIDEPHTFKRGNATYREMMKLKPQIIIRYGATFDDDLTNLVNELTAVEAFNQDLVKGIVAHIEEFDDAQNASVRVKGIDGNEAKLELNEGGQISKHKLVIKDSFATIHDEMHGLFVTAMNKSKIALSNGLELSKGDWINPYSYSQTLQRKMMQNAIQTHFEIERRLFFLEARIKPLTLFFIDDIESYRDDDGAMRLAFEEMLTARLDYLISKEKNDQYKNHLKLAKKNVSGLHGGYFSRDNTGKDEKIEAETREILHDKETLLSFGNPRRFIFSKWTLREGWDNPNVFTICKLRSSGSETSKLQEVGRGLRLPVTEHMTRDKSGGHELHYFVDFTESDFAEKLVSEVNQKSNAGFDQTVLSQGLINALLANYDEFGGNKDELLEALDKQNIITRSNEFKEGGYKKLKAMYPEIFKDGVKSGKIKIAKESKSRATIRSDKYAEIKALWESINRKVILEYEIKDESEFQKLFNGYVNKIQGKFKQSGTETTTLKLRVINERMESEKEISNQKFTPIKMMDYSDFLKKLSKSIAINKKTLNGVFIQMKKDGFDISEYMSQSTISMLKAGFESYLMEEALGQFKISYKQVSNKIHPTKFTTDSGSVLEYVLGSDLGINQVDEQAPSRYLFEEIFYDSFLELQNIRENISDVVVYSKIPKNSIRIPLVGGGTYSPDFAYVITSQKGDKTLNLIVETKDKTETDLAVAEKNRKKFAEKFFSDLDFGMNIQFEEQLSADTIEDLLKKAQASQN